MLSRAFSLVSTGIFGLGMALAAPVPPGTKPVTPLISPGTFLEEKGARVLTIDAEKEGRFTVTMFPLGAGGTYSRWVGGGEASDKGIVFGQRSEEGTSGTLYLASGSQTKINVKINPGQPAAQDAGLGGNYHRVTDEKLSNTMKKDFEVTEKRLETSIRDISKKLTADDKPGLQEWKKRWPDIRDRVVSSRNKPPAAGATPPPSKPGFSAPASQQKPASWWMAQAEVLGGAINFIMNGVPVGLPPGWEGRYEDGFGGFVDLETRKNGDLIIELNSTRGESMSGKYDGRILAASIKNSRDGKDDLAEFTDKNPDATKDGAPPMHVKLHRVGNFLVVETTEAQRYAGRGWFDGVYIKRLRPVE